ncbi:type I pullulanase [Clostridium hydrogenum]|uniref:type I pullulanase n=1 Tax=Clostridium hydrogenum TaxID=2855764 RepID=UPI001F1F8B11|nr:type I pullulanase [Clostridium hydrogenum]
MKIDFLDKYYYSGELGAIYSKEKTVFKVWSPTAEKIVLKLYSEGNGDNLIEENVMTKGDNAVWNFTKSGDLQGTFYTYEVTVAGKTRETQDIYSKAVGVNGDRGMVVDLLKTNPSGWEKDKGPKIKNQTDAIIYELHLRDISVDEDSEIKNKGKFLSLTETGTRSAEGEKTGLDHLKELGINAVHLLPIFDFGSIDESKVNSKQYNWGYDPKNYMVPEGSYSTNPFSGTVRIQEMKKMIKALHDEGIAVIMDCVFNHTHEYENSAFNKLVPKYYYRQDDDGNVVQNSQCKNDTASEKLMFRKYMMDAVTYFAKEYHIDGFRFDLMGLHDVETMNLMRKALDKINPQILMYGEGWELGDEVTISDEEKATKINADKLDSRIAAFSDDMRDGLKGHVFEPDWGGFINFNGKWVRKVGKRHLAYKIADLKEQIKFSIVAATLHNDIEYYKVPYKFKPWAKEPTQTVNYAACHDNNTLWDKIALTSFNVPESERVKMDQMAAFIVLTSQGIPFIHNGQEFLRSKPDESGNGFVENSFNSSDSVNKIDWSRKHTYRRVFDYYKGLIKLRKAHPAFRMTTTAEIQKNLKFFDTKDSTIGYIISNNANGDEWEDIVVIINAGDTADKVSLPKGNWKVVVKEDKSGVDVLEAISGDEVTIKARTSMVLYGSM